VPGPAPTPHARRRNSRPGVTRLPAGGRPGKPPEWPLLTRPREQAQADAELELWRRLWALPQAIAWEHDRVHREVAMYCRHSVVAEGDSLSAYKAASEARQLADRLGLTPMSLRRLMWEITDDEVGQAREQRGTPTVAKTDARERFRAVDGGA
jgi:hypothetical protein